MIKSHEGRDSRGAPTNGLTRLVCRKSGSDKGTPSSYANENEDPGRVVKTWQDLVKYQESHDVDFVWEAVQQV
jgi:hypothetical protein